MCDEAIEYKTASVCIPACYIKRIHNTYGDRINICTVVGFPLGYNTTASKLEEVRQGVADGVNEVDMVINITDVKNGDFKAVEDEIRALKEAAGSRILKVIIETCYLTEEEKIKLCHAVTEAGADYIKTSTGFGTAGATLDDILLFKKYIGPDVKMKAAGGVRSVEGGLRQNRNKLRNFPFKRRESRKLLIRQDDLLYSRLYLCILCGCA